MKMPIQKLDANLSEWQYPFFHLEQHEPVLPVLTYSLFTNDFWKSIE